MYQKITEEQVRAAAAAGLSAAEAARRLGVTRATMAYHVKKHRDTDNPICLRNGREVTTTNAMLSANIPVDLLERLNRYMSRSEDKRRNVVVARAVEKFLDVEEAE